MNNKYIILFILFVILFLLSIRTTEPFVDSIYKSPNCCVIRKYLDNDTFKYKFSKSKQCDLNYTNELRTIKEGQLIDNKPFDMKDCKENLKNPIFGSCRQKGSFTCTDFISKEDCIKYPSVSWYKETCNESISAKLYYDYKTNLKPLYIRVI
jgi:hypothetical protein